MCSKYYYYKAISLQRFNCAGWPTYLWFGNTDLRCYLVCTAPAESPPARLGQQLCPEAMAARCSVAALQDARQVRDVGGRQPQGLDLGQLQQRQTRREGSPR